MSGDIGLKADVAPFLEEQRQLEKTWAPTKGFWPWFCETGHKQIGLRYIVTAFGFFLAAGVLAALMRLQLARPENGFISNDLYNQFFTMHGTTMMFLFAVPVMEGMAIYLVPLMIGTRNVAFPKMNAFGYYMYLIGGLFLWVMFFLKAGADAGWFAYVPLSGPQFSPGKRVDAWAQMITFTEISALIGAVQITVTVFKLRAPGMSLNRIPLYVWSAVIASFMIMFAMPSVMLVSGYLALDRLVGTHFFNRPEGGDPIFYQHLFWFFGHPEVYIIFLPALGFISAMLPAFTRRKVFGYPLIVSTLVFTAFMGFGVWVHHMFTTGLPQLGQTFYTAASLMIVIPTGAQIFCWLATIWSGSLRIRTPVLWILGFFFVFIVGGLSGVILSSVSIDSQVHDTFFVVAHFHYVLIGGAVFPLFGAFHYWFPKWSGRMYREVLGVIAFALMFIGFNLTFFPMHQLGLRGMPRRVYTYQTELGWENLNRLATIGAAFMALAVLTMIVNFFLSIRKGAPAGPNPWGADTLEWSTTSPPPPYDYLHLPTVAGMNPLWDAAADQPVVTGMSTETRELLVTRVLDAEPDHREQIPGSSHWPALTAIPVSFALIGGIFYAWLFTLGLVLTAVPLVGWFWQEAFKKKGAIV